MPTMTDQIPDLPENRPLHVTMIKAQAKHRAAYALPYELGDKVQGELHSSSICTGPSGLRHPSLYSTSSTTIRSLRDTEATTFRGGRTFTVTMQAGTECRHVRETKTHYVVSAPDHGRHLLYLPFESTDWEDEPNYGELV